MHRLHRRAERVAATRLDFDERHRGATLHDQIDIAMPAAESMVEQTPTITQQPARRDTFALQPKCLSLFRHGDTLTRSRRIAAPESRTAGHHRAGHASSLRFTPRRPARRVATSPLQQHSCTDSRFPARWSPVSCSPRRVTSRFDPSDHCRHSGPCSIRCTASSATHC